MRRQAARLEALRFEARLALLTYNGDKIVDGACPAKPSHKGLS
jgi:hypothetical protein